MPYRAKAVFSPSNELIFSLYTFLCKKFHKRIDLGAEWVSETESALTDKFRKQLSEINEWNDWSRLILLLQQCPGTERDTAEGFIAWLESLNAGDIYVHLSPWVKHFPEDVVSMRDRSVALLSEWNRQYFQFVDSNIIDLLQRDAQETERSIARAEAVEVIEQTTNGLYYEPIDDEQEVWLIPQYHSQPINVLQQFDGLIIVQYSSNLLPVRENEEAPVAFYRMLRAMADKTRLRILAYLKSGPKSYTDIVNYLGMSKSTVYEHMLNLRGSGLVRANVRGETATTYTLRQDAVQIMNEHMTNFYRG